MRPPIHRLIAKRVAGLLVSTIALLSFTAVEARGGEARVITITQTGCQFLEAEVIDREFEPKNAADCHKINAETGAERLTNHTVLRLEPGRYVFRVENTDVPYELGFYLRAADRAVIPFFPRVSGGGVHKGETVDYPVELKAGDYLYSCPYNPTPNYRLTVR